MRRKLIFDGRNLYDLAMMQDVGFTYYSVGRPPPNLILLVWGNTLSLLPLLPQPRNRLTGQRVGLQ